MEVLDRRILAFVGAHPFVLPAQVSRFLGMDADVIAGPLSTLAEDGLLRSERLLAGEPGLIRVTPAGLRAIGSRLPAPEFEMSGVRRDLAVVDVWVRAWQGLFGDFDRILSRREMVGLDRAAIEAGTADNGFALSAGGFGSTRRYPDLMLAIGGDGMPVEVLLWPDRPTGLEALLTGYMASPNVVAVMICVDMRDAADEIRSVSQQLGIADRVRVLEVGAAPPTTG